MKTNVYEQVTNAIIEQLEQGIIPWQKPWINGKYKGCISHVSGKPYSIINQMLLGGRTGEWLTFQQIQAEGGRVKKGEKASFVVFWTFAERYELEAVCDEHGDEIGTRKVITGHYPVLRSYNVFHVNQCEGIAERFAGQSIEYTNDPIESAEKAVQEYVNREHLKLIIENSSRAFYDPYEDFVSVPSIEQYKVVEEYYSTLFHELTHSTGHKKRLNRAEINTFAFFGDDNYSREELTAEMGSAFILHTLGIECESAFKNSAAYIQGWLKALHNDKKMIIAAAAKAEAASEYILNGTK